jgi:hypothetical protein
VEPGQIVEPHNFNQAPMVGLMDSEKCFGWVNEASVELLAQRGTVLILALLFGFSPDDILASATIKSFLTLSFPMTRYSIL